MFEYRSQLAGHRSDDGFSTSHVSAPEIRVVECMPYQCCHIPVGCPKVGIKCRKFILHFILISVNGSAPFAIGSFGNVHESKVGCQGKGHPFREDPLPIHCTMNERQIAHLQFSAIVDRYGKPSMSDVRVPETVDDGGCVSSGIFRRYVRMAECGNDVFQHELADEIAEYRVFHGGVNGLKT